MYGYREEGSRERLQNMETIHLDVPYCRTTTGLGGQGEQGRSPKNAKRPAEIKAHNPDPPDVRFNFCD